jgi:hypothetical protein
VPHALTLATWSVLGVAGAGWLAVVEVMWLPLRVFGLLVPVSVVAAVVGNLLLVDLVLRWSGSRVVAVLPALAWAAVAYAATLRRPEGDLLIVATGGLGAVDLAFLLLGMLAAVVAIARAATARPVSRRPEPAGSGSGGAR